MLVKSPDHPLQRYPTLVKAFEKPKSKYRYYDVGSIVSQACREETLLDRVRFQPHYLI